VSPSLGMCPIGCWSSPAAAKRKAVMTTAIGRTVDSRDRTQQPTRPGPVPEGRKTCDALKQALAGDIGDIVVTLERLILDYYQDVLHNAQQSFYSAKMVASIGFGVLFTTLAYTLVVDALSRFVPQIRPEPYAPHLLTVGQVGLVSGVLIEFIAGVNFWLYSRAAKQFGAFHICLERTHRYLLAYKISEKMTDGKDDTLQKLVCIMASAPMITYQGMEKAVDNPGLLGSTHVKSVASVAEMS
jgi:hypothetical protein